MMEGNFVKFFLWINDVLLFHIPFYIYVYLFTDISADEER